MSPTGAAIKTLVQCRPMWFWHVIFGALGLVALLRPLSLDEAGGGVVVGVLIVPLWNSVVLASLWRDILSRPFSFSVPGHELAWRRAVVAVALILAAVCTLASAFAPAATPQEAAIRAFLVFALSMGTFMAGVLLTMWVPSTIFLPALIMASYFVTIDSRIAMDLRASVDRVSLESTTVIAGVCIAAVAVAWMALGSRGLLRRLGGQAFLPLFSIFDGERQAAYARDRKLRTPVGGVMSAFERYVVARMRSLSSHPTLRSLWGGFYVQVGRAAPARPANLVALGVLLSAACVAMGYYRPHRMDVTVSAANLILIVIVAINAEHRVQPHGALLLNLSRADRFRSVLFSAWVQWSVAVAASLALTAISISAGHYLGEVSVFGQVYVYRPMHPMAVMFFALLLPAMFLCQLVIPRQRVLTTIVITIVASMFFISAGRVVLDAPVWKLLLLQGVSWMPFVAVARYYCYSRDLRLDAK